MESSQYEKKYIIETDFYSINQPRSNISFQVSKSFLKRFKFGLQKSKIFKCIKWSKLIIESLTSVEVLFLRIKTHQNSMLRKSVMIKPPFSKTKNNSNLISAVPRVYFQIFRRFFILNVRKANFNDQGIITIIAPVG